MISEHSGLTANHFKTRKGLQTHQRILRCAAGIAAKVGLEALTFGRIATQLSLSKSTVFAHFGSKENLQLEVLESTWEFFKEQIWRGYREEPHGVARLLVLATTWITNASYPISGGLLLAASIEYDHQPGPIRTRVAEHAKAWTGLLHQEAQEGLRRGQLKESTEPHELVFEIQGTVNQRMLDNYLFGVSVHSPPTRRVQRIIHRACTEEGRKVLAEKRRLDRLYWGQSGGRS